MQRWYSFEKYCLVTPHVKEVQFDFTIIKYKIIKMIWKLVYVHFPESKLLFMHLLYDFGSVYLS